LFCWKKQKKIWTLPWHTSNTMLIFVNRGNIFMWFAFLSFLVVVESCNVLIPFPWHLKWYLYRTPLHRIPETGLKWFALNSSRPVNKDQGGDSQNFIGKFVRFFVTLGLKILRLYRLTVLKVDFNYCINHKVPILYA